MDVHDAEARHLPGSIGSLAEQEVGHEPRYGPHQKTGLPPEGDAGDGHDGADRLELGDEEERRAPRHREGGEGRDRHDLARLRFSALERRKEGQQGEPQDRQRDQVVKTQFDGTAEQIEDEGARAS